MIVDGVEVFDHPTVEICDDVQLNRGMGIFLAVIYMHGIGLLNLARREIRDGLPVVLPTMRSLSSTLALAACSYDSVSSLPEYVSAFLGYWLFSYRLPRECLSFGRSSRC